MDGLDELKRASGVIFSTQFFCVHDGPGIRTTVFFKGCPLSCLWCHNPEGRPQRKLISFAESKCVFCGACAKVCPEAHSFSDGRHAVFRERIPDELAEASAAACASKALTVVDSRITAGELLAVLVRDRRFYAESGGGVTFSGGEPTVQKQFLSAILQLTVREGISTALETCGYCDFATYKSILPYVGLFLYDFKESDPEKHKAFTGVGNALILENLERLHGAGAKILLRCPIIPGLNDRDDHFRAIAGLTQRYCGLLGAELLPYHRLAASKASRMGLGERAEYLVPTPADVKIWADKVRSFGGLIVGA